MNHPLSSRPRPALACRVVRLSCSIIGDAVSLRSGHVATCAACRQFFGASDDLDAALRRDALRSTPEAPAGLDRGIMRAIRASRPAPVSTRPPFAIFGGVAVAALAVAFVLFDQVRRSGRDAERLDASAEVSLVVNTAKSLSDRVWNSVVPSAGTAVSENALQQELDSVYVDARSAISFLALNFLPSGSQNLVPKPAKTAAEG